MLICPGVATGERTPEQVWDTGFMVIFKPLWPSNSKLYSFHFPLSTASYFLPSVIPTTTVQPNSLLLSTVPLLILKLSSHPTQPTPPQLTSSNSTSIAQEVGKPFYMFETNTASCGGFREYRIRTMELRFGVLIMECNLRMGILRLGCFILVDKVRFITSVFLKN